MCGRIENFGAKCVGVGARASRLKDARPGRTDVQIAEPNGLQLNADRQLRPWRRRKVVWQAVGLANVRADESNPGLVVRRQRLACRGLRDHAEHPRKERLVALPVPRAAAEKRRVVRGRKREELKVPAREQMLARLKVQFVDKLSDVPHPLPPCPREAGPVRHELIMGERLTTIFDS